MKFIIAKNAIKIPNHIFKYSILIAHYDICSITMLVIADIKT